MTAEVLRLRNTIGTAGLLLAVLVFSPSGPAAANETGIEFFEKHVRPALDKHCYECHSAQTQAPKGGLLLDSRAGLLRGGESGRAVVPGRVQESLLVDAIRRQSFEMPPTGRLPDRVISNFVKWIEAGASMPPDNQATAEIPPESWQEQLRQRRQHWSWQPIRRVIPPADAHLVSQHPVDRFILASLSQAGLQQAPLGDRRTLLRRLHFVLLGTPPSSDLISRFVDDPRSDDEAWESIVDRLLASPAFGERWARHWMDVVRYAETHGSEHDAVIPKSWRYRDYLIRAFNADLPYDRFVREHLAGDMPVNARWDNDRKLNEAALGTAWLRMTEFYHSPVDVKNEEAAVIENLIDTFGKALQAQTLACARCHDHKFDPISAEDFYALYGIFASSRQGMLTVDQPEIFHIYDDELRSIKQQIRLQIARIWQRQVAAWPAEIKEQLARLTEHRSEQPADGSDAPDNWLPILRPEKPFPPEHAFYPLAELGRLGTSTSGAHFADEWNAACRRMKETLAAELPPGSQVFADLRGDDLLDWHGRGPGFANPQCEPPGEFWLQPDGGEMLAAILPAGVYSHLLSQRHGGSLRSPDFTVTTRFISALVMGEGASRLRLVVENFQGDAILFSPAMPRLTRYRSPRWIRLPIRNQWLGRRAYLELLGRDDDPYIGIIGKETPGMERPSDGRSSSGLLQVVFHDDQADRLPLPSPWGSETCGPLDGTVDEILASVATTISRAVDAWATDSCNDHQARLLNALLQAGQLNNSKGAQHELGALVDRYREVESRIPIARRVPGMMDEGSGQDAAFFPRGNHRTPGEAVVRRYLEVLDGRPFLAGTGSGRNELAHELTSRSNPLTARVIVNRLWHWTFRQGIVSTVDNFGRMGAAPVHPELLDFLASRFIERGWSIKDTLRLLVTSRTFRVRSEASDRAEEIDPGNTSWQHANLRRLEGEAIRDAILIATGSLNNKMFGPAVPVWLAESHVSNHKPKNGPLDGDGRRSIYIEVRRNNPYAFFHTFDRPKPTVTTGARDVTTVPAQSLTMLNDPLVIDQARVWGRNLIEQRERRSIQSVIAGMYLQAFGRPASSLEVARAREFLNAQATIYGLDGGQLFDDARPLSDLAHALLNHKEFIYVQ